MGTETIIIDTNIFIAALGWEGTPRRIVLAAFQGEYMFVVSTAQLAEIRRVLDYERLGFDEEEKQFLLGAISTQGTIIFTQGVLRLVRHEIDNILLEAAALTAADYLITGDKELLKLRRYSNTAIVTPEEFLKHNR